MNRHEIPEEKKGSPYIDIDVTLGDNRLNENVVNHYNAQNQLIKTLTKNYKVSYTYDAEGLRTSKTVNGEKTVCVWDGDQLVLELSESGKVQKRYIRGNDLLYADKGNNTEKQYYVTDPHGSVVQLTDENGKVTKTYEYDSFGNEVKPDKKDENPFRYCGEYYDKETEEVYLRARYYQPKMGRFLTRDTYTGEEDEPESLHLYAYCGNDGVNAWDPSGHASGSNKKLIDYYSAMGTGNTLWTRKYIYEGNRGEKKGKGKKKIKKKADSEIISEKMKVLDICTDGPTEGFPADKYGDLDHDPDNTTRYFQSDIQADQVPYIVIPDNTKYKDYKFSLGVIINRDKNEYLYGVVAELGPKDNKLGEVSIYAAWKMIHKLKSKPRIGNSGQKGKWQIILYKTSAPNADIKHGGWKYKPAKLKKQLKKQGKKFYKKGKCLN